MRGLQEAGEELQRQEQEAKRGGIQRWRKRARGGGMVELELEGGKNEERAGA